MSKDILSLLVQEYFNTGDESIIKKIKYYSYPIIQRLIDKWKINTFPTILKEKLKEDAVSVVLIKAINYYDPNKGSKFSSIYGTMLNFYLRKEYMKFFQNSKPIKKRWGRFHEYSMHYTYENGSSLEELIEDSIDLDQEIEIKLMKKHLNEQLQNMPFKDCKLLKEIFFSNKSNKKIAKEMGITNYILKKRTNEVLNMLKNRLT